MQDIEKNRVEYVARMEETVQHLKRQLDEVKPLAEKWTPIVASEMVNSQVRITLSFGGKRVTGTFPAEAFAGQDVISLTSSVVDTLCESIVVDALRVVVKPEVEKMMHSTKGISGAGKW